MKVLVQRFLGKIIACDPSNQIYYVEFPTLGVHPVELMLHVGGHGALKSDAEEEPLYYTPEELSRAITPPLLHDAHPFVLADIACDGHQVVRWMVIDEVRYRSCVAQDE